MSAERSATERLANFSQKIDLITIIAGIPIYFLISPGIGAIMIFGSVATYIPAEYLKRRSRKKG